MSGWIKLHRSIAKWKFIDNPEYVSIWLHLLISATHEATTVVVGHQKIYLKPGQLLTGRDKISKATGINRNKVERIMRNMESEQQIEQQTFTKYRIISIVNWTAFQCFEQQSEQQVSNKRATNEHIQEVKEVKEESILSSLPTRRKEIVPYQEIVDAYHDILPSLSSARVTEVLKRSLRARWGDSLKTVTAWREYFEMVKGCPFLMGEKDWRANLIWLVKPVNMSKVLNGSYLPKQTKLWTVK